jgi:BASS family bile acid:Na+ symporter
MLQKLSSIIVKYFRVLFLLAVIYWLTLPDSANFFYWWLGRMMVAVIYLSAIDIEYSQIKTLKHYRKEVSWFFVIQMVLLPIVIYFVTKWFSEHLAQALFLLCAAPAWFAAISFTRIMKGNVLLSLCITIASSVLVPISIPLLSYYIVKNEIQVDAIQMFIDLVLYCIIPLIAWYLTKKYLPKVATALTPHVDVVSILLIAMMIAWPVWQNAAAFLSTPLTKLLLIVGILFVLATILLWVGWYIFDGKTKKEKISWWIAKCFMNISLATVIAAKYFAPEVLLIVILYEFPWDLMLIPYRWIIQKVKA